MEQVGNLTDTNKLQQRSSQADLTTKIPIEKQQAMGSVFDRWRLNCGWNPWDNRTQMAAIASFVASLDREDVPASAYSELYERVLQMRAQAIQAGKQLPNFGVDLMLAAWGGDWGLRAELKKREIERARSLPETAASVCDRCYGSGFETHPLPDGYQSSRKCDHRPRVSES